PDLASPELAQRHEVGCLASRDPVARPLPVAADRVLVAEPPVRTVLPCGGRDADATSRAPSCEDRALPDPIELRVRAPVARHEFVEAVQEGRGDGERAFEVRELVHGGEQTLHLPPRKGAPPPKCTENARSTQGLASVRVSPHTIQ